MASPPDPLQRAAKEAAARLLEGSPSPEQLERVRELLLLADDSQAAVQAGGKLAQALRARAQAADRDGDLGGAVAAYIDAASSFQWAGAERDAQACAERLLEKWPEFERAKSLEFRSAPSPESQEAKRPLRRLPKAGAAPAEGSLSESAAPGRRTVVPSMILEGHARALRLAGKEREARARFDEAIAAMEAEVARRRATQEWGEALSAARGLLRLAFEAGGKAGLDAVRPDFIAVAREAAAEALTPDYLAQGGHAFPEEAIHAALLEAHALGNESLAEKYEEEAALVLERTGEILAELADPQTAAQAILAWEGYWAVLDTRPDLRRAALEEPQHASDLAGKFAPLQGLAETHPLRREVAEFAGRLNELTAQAPRLAAQAYEKAARATLPRDPATADALLRRALQLRSGQASAAIPDGALALRRDAALALGDRAGAERFQEELLVRLKGITDPREVELRSGVLRAEFAAGGSGRKGAEAAREALAGHLLERGSARFANGERRSARADFAEAAALGSAKGAGWLRLLDLAGGG